MKLMHYIAQVWGAIVSPPSPDTVRKNLLRKSQLEYFEALENAEDHAVQAEAYKEQGRMLRERIGRLSQGAANV